ncbi:VOC family protein [Spelaeicoccus albus]
MPDVDAARDFYSHVLGWEFALAGPPEAGFFIAHVRGHAVAGLGRVQNSDQPSTWVLYFATDDADAGSAAITASGGTVVRAVDDIGDFGRIMTATDPTGARFGLWEAKNHIGVALVNEPGGITWEDLRSTDPAAAQNFYTSLFDFDLKPVDMAPADYLTFHLPGDDGPLGGIGGFMGAPGRSHWIVYFSVADAAAAVRAAERAGGSITAPPFETPFGTMAQIADPGGAEFQIVQATTPNQRPDDLG